MKTIAISIDETTVARATRFAARRRRGRTRRANLSAVVREALVEYLDRQERIEIEQRDRAAISRHKAELAKEARALVAEQAKL